MSQVRRISRPDCQCTESEKSSMASALWVLRQMIIESFDAGDSDGGLGPEMKSALPEIT